MAKERTQEQEMEMIMEYMEIYLDRVWELLFQARETGNWDLVREGETFLSNMVEEIQFTNDGEPEGDNLTYLAGTMARLENYRSMEKLRARVREVGGADWHWREDKELGEGHREYPWEKLFTKREK